MKIFSRLIICLSIILHSSPSLASPSRPLFNKKELLRIVQNHHSGTLSKAELLKFLDSRNPRSQADQAVVQQIKTYPFQNFSWRMSYADNELTIRVTQPEIRSLKITKLDRLWGSAEINGRYIQLQNSVATIIEQLEPTLSTQRNNVFNLLFIEKAEAFLPIIAVVGAGALAVLFMAAGAAMEDEKKIEDAFIRVNDSCQKDMAAKASAPGGETRDALEKLSEFGYKHDDINWYTSVDECLSANPSRHSQRFCSTSVAIHTCMGKLQENANRPKPAPPSPTAPAPTTPPVNKPYDDRSPVAY